VHEPEHAREHRPVAAAPERAPALAHHQVLDPGRHDRHRDEELDQCRRQPQRPGHRERERDRVAEGERGDHPQSLPPLAQAVDGREHEEKEEVVGAGHVGDVAEAELGEGEELRHQSASASMRRS
jgi:hypothetical protein